VENGDESRCEKRGDRSSGEGGGLCFHGTGQSGVEFLGGEFATTIAFIVDRYGADRFEQCRTHRCGAVFIDLTRNGSQRHVQCQLHCTCQDRRPPSEEAEDERSAALTTR